MLLLPPVCHPLELSQVERVITLGSSLAMITYAGGA